METLAGLLQRETEPAEDIQDAYDLIVVDNPPIRQAIDSFETPQRLQSPLDKHVVRWFIGSSKGTEEIGGIEQTGRVA